MPVTRKKPAADAALRSALSTFLNMFAQDVVIVTTGDPAGFSKKTLGPAKTKRAIHRVNLYSEALLRAFKAANREHVRQRPDRNRRGETDSALRTITPIIEKALRA